MSKSRVVSILSQKGGAGKSTVTMQLAGGLAKRGLSVAVIDLDPQETAWRWAAAAAPESPFPAAVSRLHGGAAALAEAIAQARAAAAFVLLDCPPSVEHPHTLAALDQADLAVVPVVPSPADLWSTRGAERLILQTQAIRPGLKAGLLPNRVMRTNLAWDVLEVMREFSLPVLAAALSQRSAYAESAVTGGTVYSLGRSGASAAKEVDQLTKEIIKLTGDA